MGFWPAQTNELASVDELFSADAWAENILGLAVVLGLLITTVGAITWSMCGYINHFKRVGKQVRGRRVSSPRPASLLVAPLSTADNLCRSLYIVPFVRIVLYALLSGAVADLLRALRHQLGLRARPRVDDVQAFQHAAGGAPCRVVDPLPQMAHFETLKMAVL